MEKKKTEECKKAFLCSGPLCKGQGNAVQTRGTYCTVCNQAIANEARGKKFIHSTG